MNSPLLACLLASSSPRAWNPPDVAVVGLHIAGLELEAASKLADDLARNLDLGNRTDGLPPHELVPRVHGLESEIWSRMYFDAAREARQSAERQLTEWRPDHALGPANEAVRLSTWGLRAVPDSRDLVDSLVVQARVLIALDRQEEARQALVRALVLNPTLELSAPEHDTQTVLAYRVARDTVRRGGQGSLKITSPDFAGRTWIDGRITGPLPLMVQNLPAGTHHVLVRDTARNRWWRTIEIRPGEVTDLDLQADAPAGDGPPLPEEGRREAVGHLYRALGPFVHAEFVLVGGRIQPDTVSLQLYSVTDGVFSEAVIQALPRGDTSLAGHLALDLLDMLTATGALDPDHYGRPLPLHLHTNAVLEQELLVPRVGKSPLTGAPADPAAPGQPPAVDRGEPGS